MGRKSIVSRYLSHGDEIIQPRTEKTGGAVIRAAGKVHNFGQQIARHNQRRGSSLRWDIAVGRLAGDANRYPFFEFVIVC